MRFFLPATAFFVTSCLLAPCGRSFAQTTDTILPLPPQASPVAAPDPTSIVTSPPITVPLAVAVVINGRGFGHGRGLGQWGAYGYAAERGWNYRQILDHFYGGTVAGAVSPLSAIGVRLVAYDNKPLVVYQPKGRLYTAIDGQSGYTLPPGLEGAQSPVITGDALVGGPASAPVPVAAGSTVPSPTLPAPIPEVARVDPPLLTASGAAIKIELIKDGIVASFGPGCAGPWTARPAVSTRSLTVSTGAPDPVVDANDPNEMLQVCEGKSRRVYRGELLATSGNPGQRAVNLVGLDAYLRGVVPREILSSWADRGMAALQAQAVAARSYAAAEKRNGFSNTCDTISCQVYRGRGVFAGTVFQSLEDPRTDQAIASTANEIRVVPRTGKPVRTEFSASTGGFTAGGDFPAVTDEGDAITSNPNHAWTVRFPVTRFANTKLGTFREAKVASRDGNGADGGRVTKVQLLYEKGATTLSGDELMRKYGLRSSWFSFTTEYSFVAGSAPIDTTPTQGVGDALTGDAGGPVAVGGVVREVDTGSSTPTSVKPKVSTTKSPSTKVLSTKNAKQSKRTTTTVAVAVAVGADPVRVVVGSAIPVGSPTTIKPSTKKSKSVAKKAR